MASTSSATKTPLPVKEPSSSFLPYPPPLAKHEDVVANPKLFISTLEKLHASMGTKFMIPIIGGKELDLHRLFVEVTSRGGIEKIIRDRRWKEVTAVFNFPSTATNASFVLRKYYFSLLRHYEQIYYFKARGWNPACSEILHSPSTTPGLGKRSESFKASPESQATGHQQTRTTAVEFPAASSGSSPVIGVIDGKFESGYLVTVTIGSEKLKGVLYQASQNALLQMSQGLHQYGVSSNRNDNAPAAPGVHRRRRRKKSEIKRRDPAHPKPNRSGYNFFFAEQHARLKPLHPRKDREISRMIGELWNKLKESDKKVYQDKAIQDKERYRVEMEDYRERLRTGQVISDAVPLQQRFPEPDVGTGDADAKIDEAEAECADSQIFDNESGSSRSEFEDDKTADKDSDAEVSLEAGVGGQSSLAGMEMSTEDGFELKKPEENVGDAIVERVDGKEESSGHKLTETNKE
ncbi:high mobility group B protein 15 isoform X1 [Ziziphus jujuba]|uniref:High mobility group B protein 15 isoform X1 n=1 Tax=Ziziphus jujuba TaxID=326968 RepID=A0ABM3IR09_ZIZJJ|nr:high mobility group B protein 15 isoform X1 [Ziziphus jujuba]XP_048333727.2 high mobility group B protein 15 isoform X1 [Ziziphus jujuba]XP_060671775.1 high mobility group B protein 15 isoform X1 [Ziziphus jujuba]